MTVLGTVLASAFILFIWFLFGWRKTHPNNSIETSALKSQNAIPTSNFKFTSEKEKVEMENMNAQSLSQTSKMNNMRTGNSWKPNEISLTQVSDISDIDNSTITDTNSSIIQKSQSTQDSATIGEEDDSLEGMATRRKSVYFSAAVPDERYLKTLSSLECAPVLKSMENPSVNELSAILVENTSSAINLPSQETGISVTDMTAEMPSQARDASIIKLVSDLEVDISTTKYQIGSLHNKKQMLQSASAKSGTCEADLNTEYSMTKLRSSDTESMLDTDIDSSMETDSTSDYMLVEKKLSDNYHNSDSEFTAIMEASQQNKSDEIATAEEASSLSGSFITVDYEPIVVEPEAYLHAN